MDIDSFSLTKKTGFHECKKEELSQFKHTFQLIIQNIDLFKYRDRQIRHIVHLNPDVGIESSAISDIFKDYHHVQLYVSEEDPHVYSILKSNLDSLSLSNTHTLNLNTGKILTQLKNVDLIYINPDIDPPVGNSKIMCSLSNIPIYTIINHILMFMDDMKCVILKLPVNFDIKLFRKSLYVNITMNSYKIYNKNGKISFFLLHIPLVKNFIQKANAKYIDVVKNRLSSFIQPNILEFVYHEPSDFYFRSTLDTICHDLNIKLTLLLYEEDCIQYTDNTSIIIIDTPEYITKYIQDGHGSRFLINMIVFSI